MVVSHLFIGMACDNLNRVLGKLPAVIMLAIIMLPHPLVI